MPTLQQPRKKIDLSVLVIEVVGRLWATNSKSPSNRVVMIDGVSQTTKQKTFKIS